MKTNVRTAKAQLSALLERAAAGEEIVITSDGRPKAKLVPIGPAAEPFRVDRRLLAVRPLRSSSSAEAIVRSERDGRD
jgi:prevent-host-death family protein